MDSIDYPPPHHLPPMPKLYPAFSPRIILVSPFHTSQMRTRSALLLLSAPTTIFCVFILLNWHLDLFKFRHNNSRRKFEANNNSLPLILGWNDYYIFGNIALYLAHVANSVKQCPFKCEYSADRNMTANASAIIFHVNSESDSFPSERAADQLYTFFIDEIPQAHLEPPQHFANVSADFFNVTITFRTDSTIFYPYDVFEPFEPGIDAEEERWNWEEVQQKVAQKDKLALIVSSNCESASKREEYLDELKRHMSITDMGKCVERECDYECYRQQLDEHFFYLAFENSVCRQYVSEKFWNLKQLIVPVVLSANISLANLDIPAHTYIDASQFASPQHLAEHLESLAANRTEYLRYFEWTARWKRTSFHQIAKPIHYYHQAMVSSRTRRNGTSALNPMCQLCKMAWQGEQTRIENIWTFWNTTEMCVDNYGLKLLHMENKMW